MMVVTTFMNNHGHMEKPARPGCDTHTQQH